MGGVVGDGDGTGSGGVAVIPLREEVARLGDGLDGHYRTFVVGAPATDGTHRLVGAEDGDGVLADVGREGGHIGGVGSDGDGTRGIGVAVIPLHKVVAGGGGGGEEGCGACRVGAAASDSTPGGIVANDGEGVLVGGIGLEVGDIGNVARDSDGAQGLRVAVVPLGEVEAVVGGSGNDGVVALGIGATAGDGTHRLIGTEDGDGELRVGNGLEGGDIGHIARHGNGTRIGEDLVVPVGEAVAVGRNGSECNSLSVIVGAAAGDTAPGVVVADGGDGVLLDRCRGGSVFVRR